MFRRFVPSYALVLALAIVGATPHKLQAQASGSTSRSSIITGGDPQPVMQASGVLRIVVVVLIAAAS